MLTAWEINKLTEKAEIIDGREFISELVVAWAGFHCWGVGDWLAGEISEWFWIISTSVS